MEKDNNTSVQADTEKTIGPIVGSLIIVVILIMGALYFWSQILNRQNDQDSKTASTTPKSSDDLQTLKRDLDATNLKSIDAQVKVLK